MHVVEIREAMSDDAAILPQISGEMGPYFL